MKFSRFSPAPYFVALFFISTISCKKDISFDNPSQGTDGVRTPIKQYYTDSSAGFCDFYQQRDSVYEPGILKDFYNLSAVGTATKMPYAKVLSSFQVLSSGDVISGQGVSLSNHFEKELLWDDLKGIPNHVSHLTYDYNGNALWFKIEALTLQNRNARTMQFAGSSKIVGGTGIYVRAKGELNLQIIIDLAEPGKNIIKQQGVVEL